MGGASKEAYETSADQDREIGRGGGGKGAVSKIFSFCPSGPWPLEKPETRYWSVREVLTSFA